MALAGNLQTASLENILQMLHMSRSTGELVLVRNTRRIGIFFMEGSVVYCHSNLPAHSIEEILVRRKRLSNEDMQTYMALQRQTGSKSFYETSPMLPSESGPSVRKADLRAG